MDKLETTGIEERIFALRPSALECLAEGPGAAAFGPVESQDGAGRTGYRIVGGAAVIELSGLIDNRPNLFQRIFGGTSTRELAETVAAAAKDPEARGILLDIDSPGGGVFGLDDPARAIREAARIKPVVAYADGMMCSAAYWIGSAASVVVAGPTAEVGSIGVAVLHVDRSGRDNREGVKRTVISAGQYKRIASDEKPLTQEGREHLQAMVDKYYALFVETVAEHRNTTPEQAHRTMADGRLFVGADAVRAGLADRVGNFQDALALAGGTEDERMREKENKGPSLEELRENHPELCEKIRAAGFEQGRAEGELAGIKAERARVTEILEADGDREASLSAIREGMDAAGVFRLLFEAERKARTETLREFETTLDDSVGQAGAQMTRASQNPEEDPDRKAARLCLETARREGIEPGEALKRVLRENPELKKLYAATFAA